MATIGKPVVDRVQAILSAARLEASAIRLSSLGSAELIAHQPGAAAAASDPATLIVSCVDLRIEITAIWQNHIVLMHAATLSNHDPPEAQLSQILAETARSTVALSQAAPGLQIGSGWLIGARTEQSPLAAMLAERFGFKFHILTDPASTPGVTAEANSSLAMSPLASAPLGLLLRQAAERVDAVDFLHPRRQHPKPDRRKLYMGLGAAAGVLLLLGLWGGIQRRVWQYDAEIAKLTENNNKIKALLDKSKDLRETAGWVEDWTHRDIDWLDQFRVIEQAKNGADKLYLTTFDGNVATRDKLAAIVAAGRAKVPNEVDEFEELGYRVTPKEISEDTTDPQYPVKIDLNLELVDAAPKPSAAPSSATTAKPDSGTSRPTTSAPSPSPPASTPPPAAPPAASTAPTTAPPAEHPPAKTRQAETGPATAQPAVSATPVPAPDDAPQAAVASESPAQTDQTTPSKN
jgi:hypothetical protein